jgi:sialidase-1
MYSDDDGATWQLGATDIGSSENHMSNECQAVERPDGSILINFRGLLTRRIQAISFDGGLTFGPSRLVPELKEPIDGCEGSLIGYPSHNLTLYSGPNSQDYRVNMTLWASADGGDSWKVLTQVELEDHTLI